MSKCLFVLFSLSDACELTLDAHTADRYLKLSDNNKKVTLVEEEQPYPDHPERYDCWQLLCESSLTGRCYWEVEWEENVHVAVTYKKIRQEEDANDHGFGKNDWSWSLYCSKGRYFVCHNNKQRFLPLSFSSSVVRGVSVYVDCPAGILSFYIVSSDSLTHLYTFNTTFTEPLYPGFGFTTEALPGSSVFLCALSLMGSETLCSGSFQNVD